MRYLLRDLLLILGLASLWGMSGYFVGAVMEAMGLNDYPLGIILASLNLILGMMLFLGITIDPTAVHIFFEEAKSGEAGLPTVGCLWLLPMGMLIFGVGTRLISFVNRFITFH